MIWGGYGHFPNPPQVSNSSLKSVKSSLNFLIKCTQQHENLQLPQFSNNRDISHKIELHKGSKTCKYEKTTTSIYKFEQISSSMEPASTTDSHVRQLSLKLSCMMTILKLAMARVTMP